MRYKSVLQNEFTKNRCYLCKGIATEWHHIFNASFKKKSEQYGAMVRLCHRCHQDHNIGVHHNQDNWNILREEAQQKIMAEQGWSVEEWRKVFEINYL